MAWLDAQIQLLDKRALRIIRKRDVVQLDIALHLLKHDGIRRVRLLRRFLDQRKDAPRAGKRVLQLRHHAADFVKRLGVLCSIAQEHGKLTHGERAARRNRRQRAGQRNAGIDQRVDKARRGIGN